MWKAILGFLLGVGKKILCEIWAFIKSEAVKDAIQLKKDALLLIVAAEQLRHPDNTPYEWNEKFMYVFAELYETAKKMAMEHAKTAAIDAIQIAMEEVRVAVEKIRGEAK